MAATAARAIAIACLSLLLSACATSSPTVAGESVAVEPDAGGQETAATNPATPPLPELWFEGVNLAGADFGFNNLPGEFGTDYIYPTATEIDFFTNEGMTVFRLPFRWERLQPTLYSDLADEELARLDSFVSSATEAGAAVILDPHNYARYHGVVIGTEGLDVEAFVDFWSRLSDHFAGNDRVIFGLMNEPHDMETELWLSNANAALAAIRDTGAQNLVLVPGNGYSGAHGWRSDAYGTPNAVVMQGVVDPIDNYAFDVHQYLDDNHSGTSAACVSPTIGSERLADVTNWLREHDERAFLGEFGGGDSSQCLEALDDMLDYLETNDDVWLGWTYWAAGPWWGDDIFEIQPGPSGIDDAQMGVLQEHLS